MASGTLTVGMFGGGTVGGGVIEILRARAALGPRIRVRKICVRNASRRRNPPTTMKKKTRLKIDSMLDECDIFFPYI